MLVRSLLNIGPHDFPGGLIAGGNYEVSDDLGRRLIANGWAEDANNLATDGLGMAPPSMPQEASPVLTTKGGKAKANEVQRQRGH